MRSIVDLPQGQLEALSEVCRREGISRAEAIRRAVALYIETKASESSEEAFGLWASRGVNGLDYERALRTEWEQACEPSSTPTS